MSTKTFGDQSSWLEVGPPERWSEAHMAAARWISVVIFQLNMLRRCKGGGYDHGLVSLSSGSLEEHHGPNKAFAETLYSS